MEPADGIHDFLDDFSAEVVCSFGPNELRLKVSGSSFRVLERKHCKFAQFRPNI